MKNVISIVGNRPQFIKMAPISDAIRSCGFKDTIIHTGQHYDHNLSDIFFKELNIPSPDIQLAVKGKTHGSMTAELLIQLEQVFKDKIPTGIILYGDTNSTLAAALIAAKMHIPIAHIEAGPRTFDMTSPEEVNRVIVDHISTFHFAPDAESVKNLKNEGLSSNVHFTGDVMYDAFLKFSTQTQKKTSISDKLNLKNKKFTLMTIHRQENTDDIQSFHKLIQFLINYPHDIVFPMHPRFMANAEKFHILDEIKKIPHVTVIPAVGYLDMIELLRTSNQVLSDSGGLQKEAFFAHKPCGIFLDRTPWPEIYHSGWQIILGTMVNLDIKKSNHELNKFQTPKAREEIFGNGSAASKIVNILKINHWFN